MHQKKRSLRAMEPWFRPELDLPLHGARGDIDGQNPMLTSYNCQPRERSRRASHTASEHAYKTSPAIPRPLRRLTAGQVIAISRPDGAPNTSYTAAHRQARPLTQAEGPVSLPAVFRESQRGVGIKLGTAEGMADSRALLRRTVGPPSRYS